MARVLLAADPEGLAEATLPMLARLLRPADEVLVLRVASPRDRVRRDRLDDLAAALRGFGAAALVGVRPPEPDVAGTLIQTARSFRAQLVALGTHGRGRLGTIVAGSVSHAVAAGLDCRVLIVHADRSLPPPAALQPARLARILLAVDEATGSKAATALAAELARRHGAGVIVFHARTVVRRPERSRIEDPARAASQVGRARLELELDGVGASGLVGVAWRGVPRSIAAVADGEDADLIVLDSRRLADWSVLAGSSTTYGLLPITTRPVLLAERMVTQKAGERSEQWLPARRAQRLAGALSASLDE